MKTPKTSLLARMKAKKADPKKKPMTVEGSAARPRLDRPMRMKRADGGPTISKDSKEYVDEKRKAASGHGEDATLGALSAAGLGAMRLMSPGAPKFMKGLLTAGAGLNAGTGAMSAARRSQLKSEADRVERGIATSGREDGDEVKRKKGGKVCK